MALRNQNDEKKERQPTDTKPNNETGRNTPKCVIILVSVLIFITLANTIAIGFIFHSIGTINLKLKVPTVNPTITTSSIITTNTPTLSPSKTPTLKPSNIPTLKPTNNPSHFPSNTPSIQPSNIPTVNPTTRVNNPESYQIGDYKYSALSDDHGKWLLCNGSAISRSEYSQLFQVYGTIYGSSSSTTFNLPDFTGKVPGIISNTYPETTNIGTASTTLTETNIPSHYHFISNSGDATGYYSSSSRPYLATEVSVGSGLISNDNSEYQLRATASLPNYYRSSTIGSGSSFSIMQPTLFAGNIFVFAG